MDFGLFCAVCTAYNENHFGPKPQKRRLQKVPQGEMGPLRDDFQVLFCHYHELNILF